MSRTSKLTPELQEEILDYVRAGNYYEPSARAAGVDPGTLRRWMEKGDTDPGHPDEPKLDDMTVRDLRKLADHHEIPHTKSQNRAQLVELLEAAEVGSWDRYRAFRAAIEQAEALAEVRAVTQWNMHFEKSPAEIGKFLARKHRDRWSDTTRLQLSGDVGAPVAVDVNVSADQDAVRELLLADPEAATLLDVLHSKLTQAAAS